MPTVKEHTFTVSGTGRFPLDMLRYDFARPRQSADSTVIEKTLSHVGGTQAAVVHLTSLLHPPTVARWLSFGWTVSEVSSQKVAL